MWVAAGENSRKKLIEKLQCDGLEFSIDFSEHMLKKVEKT